MNLDKKIEINNKIISELAQMAKELYNYWFVQFDFPDANGKRYRSSGGKMTYNPTLKREIPDGWEVKTVEDAADCLFGFPFNTEYFNENATGKPIVRIRDINDNSISCYTTEQVDEKYRLNNNDILIGMDGNFHINIWSNNYSYLNQRCARIRCDINENTTSLFVIHQISPHIKFREKTASRTTVGHLSNDDIRKINIILPPNNESLLAFEEFSKKVIHCKNESQELAKLRDWLLPMLMNGQITVAAEAKLETEKDIPVINLSQQQSIPVDAHILGGHIVNKLYGSSGWGRTKLQKSLHLVEYHCQINLNSNAVQMTAGPHDQQLMNYLDSKFRQFNHVAKVTIKEKSGRTRYDYKPTSKISEVERAFEQFDEQKKRAIDNLLAKLKNLDLARAEIVSTLYAVWNNRLIKNQEITNESLILDFYAWSPHKSEFPEELVLRAINYMKKESIIPVGWGKYIGKA